MPNNDILTTQEVATFLGAHIETIRRLARKGNIPAFKLGKDWRFSLEAVRHWALNQQHFRQRQPTVLVVDDDIAITQLARRMIAPLGCNVATAGTGTEGLDIFSAQSIDLVLLDLVMPKMNGAELIERLRCQQADIPVIVITGYPESDMLVKAMQFGPLMLLKKPIEKEALVSAVQLALQSQLSEQGSPETAVQFA